MNKGYPVLIHSWFIILSRNNLNCHCFYFLSRSLLSFLRNFLIVSIKYIFLNRATIYNNLGEFSDVLALNAPVLFGFLPNRHRIPLREFYVPSLLIVKFQQLSVENYSNYSLCTHKLQYLV